MKTLFITTLLTATSLLGGCANINNTLTTEQSLQNKASAAIHANPDNIVITNKKAEGERVEFTASVLDKTYHCHYTATLLSQTDTVCQ
ncbi:hypothetical protein [Marinomonas pollencensis]|uniref:Lipoprotein n=1 Tax=Marinomonas pollencensis TaxID=491954 RepID=A0A3E0DUP0_9GAMM|nr:hypothetical protein [Marinomonas pollencensis]REG85842.1 hypothetical protein DFP81_102381 [Marinomonas pollencensis]